MLPHLANAPAPGQIAPAATSPMRQSSAPRDVVRRRRHPGNAVIRKGSARVVADMSDMMPLLLLRGASRRGSLRDCGNASRAACHCRSAKMRSDAPASLASTATLVFRMAAPIARAFGPMLAGRSVLRW